MQNHFKITLENLINTKKTQQSLLNATVTMIIGTTSLPTTAFTPFFLEKSNQTTTTTDN